MTIQDKTAQGELNLRIVRTAANISLAQLSKAAGLSISMLSRYECGQRNLSKEANIKLVKGMAILDMASLQAQRSARDLNWNAYCSMCLS